MWLLALSLACSTHDDLAWRTLQSEGYAQVELTPTGNTFDFIGKRDGDPCGGTVIVDSSLSVPAVVLGSCHRPNSIPGLILRCARYGETQACLDYGNALFSGKGIDEDRVKAATMWELACAAGLGQACNNLGDAVNRGVIPGGPERALELFLKACEADDMLACKNAGVVYRSPAVGQPDKALEMFERACEGGNGTGCNEVGVLLDKEDRDGEAYAFFRKACDDDTRVACLNAGRMSRDGRGTEKSPGQARKDFDRGCRLGDSKGCTELGALLSDRPSEALAAWEAGCDKEAAAGCRLAASEHKGDAEKARTLLERACRLGDKAACAPSTPVE